MKRVLILHGWGGSDHPHWQSYIAAEVAREYGCVSFLRFSDADLPDRDRWLNELKAEVEAFKPTVVVCHSIANILWFHLCNNDLDLRLEKLFLVAPPSLSCDIKELASFYPCEIPQDLRAKNSLLISSDNDPYMSYKEVCELAKDLGVELHTIKGGGHINTDSGYGEWKWLLDKI